MNYPGLGLLIVGLILWFIGGYVIGAPLVLLGQVLAVIGLVILLLEVVRGRL
jgi:hypothetical protein